MFVQVTGDLNESRGQVNKRTLSLELEEQIIMFNNFAGGYAKSIIRKRSTLVVHVS